METKRVLVIDDTVLIRASIRYCMEKIGFEVEEACDGREGLAKLREMEQHGVLPDIILTDINMPEMDGITFIKEAKKSASRFIPILVLTTESSKNKKMEGKKAGAAGWLVKPFRDQDLVAVVKKFVPFTAPANS